MTAELRKSERMGYGEVIPLALDEIEPAHPVRVFYEVWKSLAEGSEIPHRDSFHPSMAPRVLPWLMVLERQEGRSGPEHHVRLQGSSLSSVVGESWTGQRIEDKVAKDYLPDRLAEIERLVKTGDPAFSYAATPREEREFIRQIRGLFLFRTDDADRPQIFMVVAPIDERI